MTGTIVNTGTIIAGSLIGVLIHSRLPRKYVDVVFQGIGLFALGLGISMTIKSSNFLLAIISIVVGAVLGEWMQIDRRIDRFSAFLQTKSRKGKGAVSSLGFGKLGFTEGLITATMLFCVGSMSILGAIEDGTGQTPNLLYTKSIMDGVTSVVLASSFGAVVMLSAVPVFIFQGSITVLAYYISRLMSEQMIADLTTVGGIMLIGMALNILKIKDIKVLNMLPSLVIILILSYFWG